MRNGLYILGQLSDEDIEWLIKNGRRRDLAPDTVLIEEGVPGDALYIVLDGSLSVSLAALGGKEIGQRMAGEILGEMSFVDALPPSATVSSAGRAVVYAIERSRLRARLEQDTGFAARFYRALAMFLSDRLRHAQDLLNPGGSGSVERDELDFNVLDNVHLAGARFSRILQQFMET
jgi:CRP/FNR family cyclic AMP-dependent transcriptional regulator